MENLCSWRKFSKQLKRQFWRSFEVYLPKSRKNRRNSEKRFEVVHLIEKKTVFLDKTLWERRMQFWQSWLNFFAKSPFFLPKLHSKIVQILKIVTKLFLSRKIFLLRKFLQTDKNAVLTMLIEIFLPKSEKLPPNISKTIVDLYSSKWKHIFLQQSHLDVWTHFRWICQKRSTKHHEIPLISRNCFCIWFFRAKNFLHKSLWKRRIHFWKPCW